MMCVGIATSIRPSIVIKITLIFLSKITSGQPILNQNATFNIGAFLPLNSQDSTVYIFDAGDNIFGYTDLAAIIDSDSDGKVTFKCRNLELSRMRHNKPQVFGLVLIGSTNFKRTPRLLSENCKTDRLGGCFFTETWMFVVTQNQNPSAPELVRWAVKNPLLLVHVSLSEPIVRTKFIIYSHPTPTNLANCTEKDHNCLYEVRTRYDSALRMRQTCTDGLDYADVSFLPVAALKLMPILGCRSDSKSNGTPSFEVWPILETSGGNNYPEGNDFIMSTRDSAVLYMISPSTPQTNRNPYTSPLEPSAWLFLAVFLLMCGLLIFKLQGKLKNFERLCVAWLMCIRLALDQQLSSIRPRRFMAIIAMSTMLLTNLYRCYLNSEFTVVETGNPNNISSIADLLFTNSNVSLVVADEHCEVVKKHRRWPEFPEHYVNMHICAELGGDLDQCWFINRIYVLYLLLNYTSEMFPRPIRKLRGRLHSVPAICSSEIHGVIAERMASRQQLPAFLTSQADFPLTWFTITESTVDFREQKYTHKLDRKISYFSPTLGVQFPLRLKSSQDWIRRNLRAIAESGILNKETHGDKNLRRSNRRLCSMLKASELEFQPISLGNSWFIVIMEFFSIFLATSMLAFALEMFIAMKAAQQSY